MKDEQDNAKEDRAEAERELSDYRNQAEQLAFENKMLRGVLDLMPDNISEIQQFAVAKDFADDVCLAAVEIDQVMKNRSGA